MMKRYKKGISPAVSLALTAGNKEVRMMNRWLTQGHKLTDPDKVTMQWPYAAVDGAVRKDEH